MFLDFPYFHFLCKFVIYSECGSGGFFAPAKSDKMEITFEMSDITGLETMSSKCQKKKCSIAEFLLTDSKKAPEKHGDVHFAEFLANKIRCNFLCPK